MEKLILVDTSFWIEILRKNGDLIKRDKFQKILLQGKVAWCDAIKLELWNGTRNKKEIKILEEFDINIPSLEITSEVWKFAFKIGSYLRRRGVTVPCVDILIISTAMYYNVELLHSDKHFEMILKILPK